MNSEPDAFSGPRPPGQTDTGTPAAPGEAAPPVPIPDHQLLRGIGRGSYGSVWLARNMMGRYRAVKIVYRKSFDHQGPFERELSGLRRFEPISRSHEGFVDVLHVGSDEAQNCFYYVMELGDDQVSGQNINPERYSVRTLAKEISHRGKFSLQECIQLGLALSQALAALHEHGLVHRDIKPSNIIFVNGVPKLADIGLVAEVNEARSYVGTEGFIPPEGPGTPQADVYSLGKVLYEASTGKDRQDFPRLPRDWDESPEHEGLLELNEIILQACKNDVARRYSSAEDLQADLKVLANGKSVRRLKFLERRLATLKRAAGISLLVAGLLTAVAYQINRERRGVLETRQRQVGADVAYGNRAMESGDLLRALPYFADGLRLDEGNAEREITHRLRFSSVLAQCPKLTQMWFAGKQVNDGEFSPDGNRVLVAEYFGQARLYDIQSGQLCSGAFGPKAGLSSAAYSPDGRCVVMASEDGTACVWDAANLRELLPLPHPDRVHCARFSPDGRRIVTACEDGRARIWNALTGQLELSLTPHAARVIFATFSNDGRLIVTASHDGTARLWDANDGHPAGPPLKHGTWVTYAAFSPDGQNVVTACADHKARVWELPGGRRIMPDLSHRAGVRSAEFSPDGRLIVTASLDGTVRLWRSDTLQPLGSTPILWHGERVVHASFSPNGRLVITTCTDGSVRIWDLAGTTMPPVPKRCSYSQNGTRFLTVTNNSFQVWDAVTDRAVSPLRNPGFSLENATLSRNARFAVSVSVQTNATGTNRFVQVWDAAGGEAVAPRVVISNALAGVSLSEDGGRLATSNGRAAQIWEVRGGRAITPPLLHEAPVGGALFSPDGRLIATQSGNQVQVWDAGTGQTAFPPLRHPLPVEYADFSPDGRFLVTCCSDNQLNKCFAQVWNAAAGQPIGPRLTHADGVVFAAFSPDSRRIITTSEDFTAILWDVATGTQLVPPFTHDDLVRAASFSPDGKWIVTASQDQTARVWSAETGDPLSPPLRHLAKLRGARFLADGRRMVTADKDGHAWIWELPVDNRPVDDLILLARFLSGNSAYSARGSARPQPASLQTIWQRLRTKYPSDFATSAEEIAAWHEFQAEESALQQQWFAAAFHLERLLTIRPDDLSLRERLARAKEHLKSRD